MTQNKATCNINVCKEGLFPRNWSTFGFTFYHTRSKTHISVRGEGIDLDSSGYSLHHRLRLFPKTW